MTLCYLAHPLAIVLTHGKKVRDFAGGNVVDPFQDAVPCFDWTPEAWKAVEYADTKLIKTPWGFKAL
jgi:hypothetical protein